MAWFKVCIPISYVSITYILSCRLSGHLFLYAVFSSLLRLRYQVLNYGMLNERWLRPLLHLFLIHICTIGNLLILPIILITCFNFPQDRFTRITRQHDQQQRLLQIPPSCVPCLFPIVFLASKCSHARRLVSANVMHRLTQSVRKPPG
jgi:hypothetical protein